MKGELKQSSYEGDLSDEYSSLHEEIQRFF